MFDITQLPKSFLGANTARGFVSHFTDCYDPDAGFFAYIIKGGPGTGKSTLMKQAAALLAERGCDVEICPCSSDPDSLDAVIVHDKKAVVLDGTAPHTVDPAYPGACETIINLSDCWKREKFSGVEREIIALTRENKRLHARASRYISAAGKLCDDNCRIAREVLNITRAQTFAATLSKKLIPEGKAPSERLRFLGGITPVGAVFLRSTAAAYDRVIVIEDALGAAADVFLSTIREYALSKKQTVITCFSPLDPDRLEHILLPDISLAFCTENRFSHPEGATRKIHARRFTDAAALSAKRARIGFNRRACDELLREAVAVIAEAKRVHDRLESYYINAMDFKAVGGLCEKITGEILSR